MSDPSSAESAASTSDSNEPDSMSSPNARKTRGDDESSRPTGPESRAPKTFGVSENQRAEVLLTDYAHQLTCGGGKPGQGYALIFSAEDSPAKTSPSPENEPDSTVTSPACSSSSPGSQLSFSHDGSWSRTFQGFSPLPTAETLPSFCQRWSTSGMASRGGHLTLDFSESLKDAAECSLSDVLEATPNPRYALSARAAAGILRRARARGRELPAEFEEALVTLAATMPPASPPMSDGISTPKRSSSALPSEAIRGPDPTRTGTLW
jgi:hypothetical protein